MAEKSEIEILLVEDDPADLELTLHALRHDHLSNQIHVVRDGQQALDFVFGRGEYRDRDLGQQPKLVLLDLKLPRVDGLEVLREMKSNDSTRMIPVVILTSSRQDVDLISGYKLGANSYLQKPVDFAAFRKIVKDLGYYWLLVNLQPPVSGTRREEGEVAAWPQTKIR